MSHYGKLIFLAKQYIYGMKLILNGNGNDEESDVSK
jgi:hypothetical protein